MKSRELVNCDDIFSNLEFPLNRIIVIHARIKRIKQLFGVDYEVLTKSILSSLKSLFKPVTILVPTFTYAFTKSGVFHMIYSRSEVGRFSEEVRKLYINARTPEPIFSFIDINRHVQRQDIDFTIPFDKGGIYDYLHQQNCIYLNIDIGGLGGGNTSMIYVEKQNNVDYRYDLNFPGVIYYNKKDFEEINYKYFARDLKLNPTIDKPKRKKKLIDDKVIYFKNYKDDIEISWVTADGFYRSVSDGLSINKRYFLESSCERNI